MTVPAERARKAAPRRKSTTATTIAAKKEAKRAAKTTKKPAPSKTALKGSSASKTTAKGTAKAPPRKVSAHTLKSDAILVGRTAKPISMSLMPAERAELEEFTALTDIGPTTLYRDLVAPKIRAAVWALKAMTEAGMEIDPRRLPATIWHTSPDSADHDDLYSGIQDPGTPR